jgi:uncharacterized protein
VVTHGQPVEVKERYAVLDLVRGFALFGVLLINLLYFFRVSVFSHILEPRNDLIARLIEFKAFDLFSMTFGAGVAVQWERGRGARFLARRFLVLLGFGTLHMTLVSNVDILMLYSVCGLALIPMLRAPTVVLATVGAALALGPSLLPNPSFPDIPALRAHAADATRIYGSAGYAEQVVFRWHETIDLILPLLIAVAQKVFGLMLAGVAVWRSGVVRDPSRHRVLLWILAVAGMAVGLVFALDVPLAAGYGAVLLAANPQGRWTRPFAAAGRMAFTNYLTQSLVFAILFYGFGLFGRIATDRAAAFGVALYGAQLWFSMWWLRRHRFGPFEWVWRSLTYGRRL